VEKKNLVSVSYENSTTSHYYSETSEKRIIWEQYKNQAILSLVERLSSLRGPKCIISSTEGKFGVYRMSLVDTLSLPQRVGFF